MSKYAKLVAFIVGGLAMTLNDFFGISALIGMEEQITQLILMALTALGVYSADDRSKPAA